MVATENSWMVYVVQQNSKKEFVFKKKTSLQEVDNVSPVKTVLGSFSQIAPKEPLLVIHVFEMAPSHLSSSFQYFWKPQYM